MQIARRILAATRSNASAALDYNTTSRASAIHTTPTGSDSDEASASLQAGTSLPLTFLVLSTSPAYSPHRWPATEALPRRTNTLLASARERSVRSPTDEQTVGAASPTLLGGPSRPLPFQMPPLIHYTGRRTVPTRLRHPYSECQCQYYKLRAATWLPVVGQRRRVRGRPAASDGPSGPALK